MSHSCAVRATLAQRVALATAVEAVDTPSAHPPTAAVRNGPELLHVHVDQLARTISLVALNGHARLAVAPVESTETLADEDSLDRRRRHTHLVGDMSRTPSAMRSKVDHLLHATTPRLIRGSMWSRGAVLETTDALSEKTITPFAHRLGVDLESIGGRLDGPMIFEHALHHSPTTFRGQWCIGMLGSNVVHRPSL